MAKEREKSSFAGGQAESRSCLIYKDSRSLGTSLQRQLIPCVLILSSADINRRPTGVKSANGRMPSSAWTAPHKTPPRQLVSCSAQLGSRAALFFLALFFGDPGRYTRPRGFIHLRGFLWLLFDKVEVVVPRICLFADGINVFYKFSYGDQGRGLRGNFRRNRSSCMQ